MPRKFRVCHLCRERIAEWNEDARAWHCLACGYDSSQLPRRVSQEGVGIRYGRGFEQFDALYRSGLRDYLENQERTGKRSGVQVRERDG